MKIGILAEKTSEETRVAASPESIKKLGALWTNENAVEILIESGAGKKASFTDEMFAQAGAKIVKDRASILKADILLCVRCPSADDLKKIPDRTLLIGMLDPYSHAERISSFAASKITALSMELVPRITRAQAMDVLSSQANLAGYKAVLDACQYYSRALPMMMTAAGTIPPTKVFVMGAGVAGLQAIATARRLGAVVSATDVRPAAKEQVESLGAKFVAVEDEEFRQAETSGGYAREMSREYQEKQADLVRQTISRQDIVITTALIPGRPAPRLIDKEMIASMKPGSVLIDLAVEQGGNIEGSKPGAVVDIDGVTVVGHRNIPGRLATDASALYAKNLLNLVSLLIDKESGTLNPDWEDEILKGVTLTRDGRIVHPAFQNSAAQKEGKTVDKTSASEKAGKESGKNDGKESDGKPAGSSSAGKSEKKPDTDKNKEAAKKAATNKETTGKKPGD